MVKIGDIVVCIKCDVKEYHLTVGNRYKVRYIGSVADMDTYGINDNQGSYFFYLYNMFMSLDEYRSKVINEILDA